MGKICKIAFLVVPIVSYALTLNAHIMESFLPSLINVRPVIQMRRYNSNTEPLVKLMDLKNFTFTIYPQSCGECKDGFLVIVVVQSYVANFENRKVIRETWGKSSNCIKVLFFTGTTYDYNIIRAIANESITYFDIVQSNFEDTYRNLPYKHVMAFKWIKVFCPQVKYIVKTDSDIIVRLEKLYKLLKKDMWGSTELIAGNIEYDEEVMREGANVMSDRIVSVSEYKGVTYPTYCWGQFVLYSADVAFRLLDESKKVPYFKIEDVYVTGILAKSMRGVRHVNLVPYWYLNRATLSNYTEDEAKKDYVYGPYSLTLDEIREYWNLILEYEQPNDVSNSPKLGHDSSQTLTSSKPSAVSLRRVFSFNRHNLSSNSENVIHLKYKPKSTLKYNYKQNDMNRKSNFNSLKPRAGLHVPVNTTRIICGTIYY